MENMSRKELTDYVNILYQLERSLYEQKSFKRYLTDCKRSCEFWKPIEEIKNTRDYRMSSLRSEAENQTKNYMVETLLLDIAIIIIGVIIGYNFVKTHLINVFLIDVFFGAGGGLFCGLVIVWFMAWIQETIHDSKVEIKARGFIGKKNEEIREYNRAEGANNERRNKVIGTELNICNKNIEETTKLLDKYYNLDLVFEKYRNLCAVSSFLEYLKSGRCETLEGSEGAYNLYENELRMNIIIDKLDIVIEHLEQIEKNQYLLYDALNKSIKTTKMLTSTCNRLIESVANIENNAEISAYNSGIVAANATYQSLLLSKYDN